MVCSVKVSMASVNSFRLYLVTKTRWACNSDTLCRARRYVVIVSAHLYGCAVGKTYRMAPIPAAAPVRKPRARKRPKDAPTHVRSWPLRPSGTQCRDIRTRFFTGVRVFNAVLGEFIARSRAVKADPGWQAAGELPHRSAADRQQRGAAFRSVEQAHGFSVDAAQSFASSLRQSWVREHLPAQETQNLGARVFDAVRQWHLGQKGKPRFKPVKRGLHSLAAKDGNGALRPKTDAAGRLLGLQWGAGFVIPIAPAAGSGRRGKEQQAELAEIEALIAAGKVLSTRIVRTVIDGRDTYRMQLHGPNTNTQVNKTPLDKLIHGMSTACNWSVMGGRPGGTRSATGKCPSTSARPRSRWPWSMSMARGRAGWSRWPIRCD
jgi:hypothetical protein